MHKICRPGSSEPATFLPCHRHFAFLLACALLLVLGSCGGGGMPGRSGLDSDERLQSAPALPEATRTVPARPASPGAAGSLGAPSELARGASFVDSDRFHTGAEFDGGLPSNRVTAVAPFLQFSPINGSTSADLEKSSYAVFSYALDGFSGALNIKNAFQSAPSAGTGFIGLANWTSDRWEWFSIEAGTQQDFGDSAPYVRASDGAVLVVLLVVRQPATLSYLRVGGNIAPQVSAIDVSPGTTVVVGGTATFTATAQDLDGSIASYDWDLDGQAGYETLGASASAQFSYPAEGEVTPRVRVNDNDGGSTEFSGPAVTVIPAAQNDPPVAALQSDSLGGNAPMTINFDASASMDPDGSIVSYEWDFDGDGAFLAGDTTAVPTTSHLYDSSGDFNAAVRVTDDLGATDTASVLITIGASTNQAPVALFQPDYYFADAPLDVQIDASLSSDPDGNVVKYEWDWDNNGSFEEDAGASAQVSHSFPNPGVYPVTLRVTDDGGDTDTVTVTLFSDNGASGYDDLEPHDDAANAQPLPGIGFKQWDGRIGDGDTDPEDEADWYSFNLDALEAVHITMSFIDADCDIDMKLFASDGTTELDSSTGTTDTETLDYATSSPGTFLLRVYKFTSEPLAVADYTLNADRTDGTLPEAVLTADVNSGSIPLTVNFDASGSYDPGGGTITSYDFDYDGNGTWDTTGDSDGLVSRAYTSVGVFNATVRVHSSLGFTDTAVYPITTDDSQGNSPTADIQANVTSGNIALTVNFDASGSTAPGGGSISNYEWDLDGNGIFESDTDAVATQTATYFKTGTYNATVRVTSNLGITDTASISITASGTMDEIEPNNAFGSSQALPLMPFNGFFCDLGPGGNDGGNEDWYSFTLNAPATVSLTMNLHDNFGDLDMKLYASDGTTEEGSSTGTDNDEAISVALDAGTYYVKCYVFSSNTTNGPGRGGYELVGGVS
ncbi:PKD domain-containing protein [bacterium]|nr:PKD domain-containing protein [bacterium]